MAQKIFELYRTALSLSLSTHLTAHRDRVVFLSAKMPAASVLLPTHVVPSLYRIALEPDLERCTFSGQCTTHLDIKASLPTITMHCYQLTLGSDVVLKCGSEGAAPSHEKVISVAYDLKAQTVTLTFDRTLPLGPAVLTTSFLGTLNDELAGFYRSKYVVEGETRNAAVTQFEATDARRCFPCWDEPALKAKFEVTVTAPANRLVISNMHVASVDTSRDGAKKTWRFHETPIISTYLVAVIVGEFDSVSARGANGVLTTVYTPVGKSASGSFALKVAVDCLEFLEHLFGLPYMGSKSDLLAIADVSVCSDWRIGGVVIKGGLVRTLTVIPPSLLRTMPAPHPHSSRLAPWRTWAPSRTARRRCSSTRRSPPWPPSNAWRKWCATN